MRTAMTSMAGPSSTARRRTRTSSASSSRAEDGARLADLKPFIRDLMAQMERDLDTKLDWVAVDHFNTGHPHTHIVIRGRDDEGKDLVMARDYIGHGVRARAQVLVTLELGPESEVERLQKLFNEVGQERLTRLDRALMARAKDGILVVTSEQEQDPDAADACGSAGSRRWSGWGWPRSANRACGRSMPRPRPSCASSASGPTSSR